MVLPRRGDHAARRVVEEHEGDDGEHGGEREPQARAGPEGCPERG